MGLAAYALALRYAGELLCVRRRNQKQRGTPSESAAPAELSFAPRSCHIPALEKPERRRAQHDDVGQEDEEGVQRTRRVTDGEQGPFTDRADTPLR